MNFWLKLRSLPSRERGLKRKICRVCGKILSVAPFAGAWIETKLNEEYGINVSVAPFAGAWIETFIETVLLGEAMDVAPFAGAWIETDMNGRSMNDMESLPSRERGLKHMNQ